MTQTNNFFGKSLHNIKQNKAYANSLSKLIFYLFKNKPNLNQYNLVRPYQLLSKLAKKYHYDTFMPCLYTKKQYLDTYFKNKSFLVDGWNYQRGIHTVALNFNSSKIPSTKGVYSININAKHLAVCNHYDELSPSPIDCHDYVFSVNTSELGKYIDMRWNNQYEPTEQNIINCFIGSVCVLRSMLRTIIKQDCINHKKLTPKSTKIYKRIAKQNSNIRHSKYSWNAIFSKH